MIRIKKLYAGYGNGDVLKDISLTVERGFLGILGPNGAGKTTLLRVLSGVLKPREGMVELDGKDINEYSRKELSRKITLISQNFYPVYDFTVREMVEMGRIPYLEFLPVWTLDDEKAIEKALKDTGTWKLANRRISQLSSGERRLVMIARAVAQDVKILLVDELELHLDLLHKSKIAAYLKRLTEKGVIVISVFHDVDLALNFSDRIVGIKNGEILFDLLVESERVKEELERLYDLKFEVLTGGSRKRILPKYL